MKWAENDLYRIRIEGNYLFIQGEPIDVESKQDGDFLTQSESFVNLIPLLKAIPEQPIVLTFHDSHIFVSEIML